MTGMNGTDSIIKIVTPLSDTVIGSLKAGDKVLLSGLFTPPAMPRTSGFPRHSKRAGNCRSI